MKLIEKAALVSAMAAETSGVVAMPITITGMSCANRMRAAVSMNSGPMMRVSCASTQPRRFKSSLSFTPSAA